MTMNKIIFLRGEKVKSDDRILKEFYLILERLKSEPTISNTKYNIYFGQLQGLRMAYHFVGGDEEKRDAMEDVLNSLVNR